MQVPTSQPSNSWWATRARRPQLATTGAASGRKRVPPDSSTCRLSPHSLYRPCPHALVLASTMEEYPRLSKG